MPLGKQFSEDLDVFSSTIKKKRNKSSQMALLARIDAYHTLLYVRQFISMLSSFFQLLKALYIPPVKCSIIYRLLIDNFHINCTGLLNCMIHHNKKEKKIHRSGY